MNADAKAVADKAVQGATTVNDGIILLSACADNLNKAAQGDFATLSGQTWKEITGQVDAAAGLIGNTLDFVSRSLDTLNALPPESTMDAQTLRMVTACVEQSADTIRTIADTANAPGFWQGFVSDLPSSFATVFKAAGDAVKDVALKVPWYVWAGAVGLVGLYLFGPWLRRAFA
jgi:hypothetical protein